MHQETVNFYTGIGWTLDFRLISNVSGTDIVIAQVRTPKTSSIRAISPAASFCVVYLSIANTMVIQKNEVDTAQHMLLGESFMVVSI